jgi:hypothetical protein
MNSIFFVVQVQRVWNLLWPRGTRRCFRFLRDLRDLASLRHDSTANFFMYLRAILCTFQISVYFYYVPVGGRGGEAGEGGWLERGGIHVLYGYS